MNYIALFSAIQIILEVFNRFIPSMPQGGSVSFSLIAIFLASYLLGVKVGVLVGLISSILQFVLGITVFYGWWSMLLDYVLPLSICGLAGLFKNIRYKNIEIPVGIVWVMGIKFIFHYLSGIFLFSEYAGNQNIYLYSLVYNLGYNIVTLVVSLILVTLIYPSLLKFFDK